jgi:putative membrane protein
LSVRDKFTDAELEAIRAATAAAERQTGGELVCVIVNRCDSYLAPVWQATALGAVGGATVASLLHLATGAWLSSPAAWLLLPCLLGAVLGVSTVSISPALRRRLVPAEVLDQRVDRRAASAFLAEEIFATRDRTGVLLFIALFEHRIRVLADRGVDQRIAEESWQPIIDRLTAGLRLARPAPAIIEAIGTLGELLTQAGVGRRTDDINELDDSPRLVDD